MNDIVINGQAIGKNHKPYIIAELSANHNGSIDKALHAIELAARMGAHAVKLQSYTADSMTIDCDKEEFIVKGGLWHGYKLYDLYREASTPYEWHERLFAAGREHGITVFSTPFDEAAVDMLETLDAPAYKIASFEVCDLSLIARVAATGKPIIISTGLASLDEIGEAVEIARVNGCQQIILLHCISSYPAPVEQANLATIRALSDEFNCVAGLSDHTLGTAVAVAAVALGACVIEKHFTISRLDKGPDSEFSIEPDELRMMCRDTEIAWRAIGSAGFDRKPAEEANVCFRRSLYFVKDIRAGETVTSEHVRRIRPGYGLAPKYYQDIIGRTVLEDIERGTATNWEQFNR